MLLPDEFHSFGYGARYIGIAQMQGRGPRAQRLVDEERLRVGDLLLDLFVLFTL